MDNPIALEKQAASIRYQLEHLHENRTPTTIGLTTTFLILTTVAVVLRFASRKVAKVAYQIDDCLVGFSLFLIYCISAISYYDARLGYGKHIAAVAPEDIPKLLKAIFAYVQLYIFAITSIKLSIIALYLRIFGSSKYRFVFIAVGVYAVIWMVVYSILTCVACRPINYYWDKAYPGGSCFNMFAYNLSAAIFNLIGDLLVLASPIPIIWRLNATRAKKLLIIGICMLGSLVCIVTFIRLFFTRTLVAFDFTYESQPSAMLSFIEVTVGLICACLPVLRPLFRKATWSSRPSNSGGYNKSFRSKMTWSRSNSRKPARLDETDSFDHLPASRNGHPGPWNTWTNMSATEKQTDQPHDVDPERAIPLTEVAVPK